MRNKFLYFGVLFLTFIGLVSFSSKQQIPDFTTEVYSRFYSYLENFREEKIYLQTDKPYYSAGENIWLKGYLVNVATLRPESLSGFIYVELFNRKDSVISRVKIPRDSTGFSGYIKLDQTIPAGDYNLRAYSQWMRNNSTDFFYSKNIYIGNQIEDAVNYQTTYGEVIDGQVLINVKFVDEHMLPISDKSLQVSGQWSGSKKRKMLLTTDSEGTVSFNLPVDTVNYMPDVLDLSLSLGSFNFETKLFLPDFSNDFDVQFFPESGVFLSSGLQSLAFKAIGTDGMSKRVSGGIYSQTDELLSEIKTQINGMGKFLLNTVPGDSYYAIITSDRGIEKRFDLPTLENEGVSLSLNYNHGKIYYSITNQLTDQSVPLFLLIHSNGKPFVVSRVNNLVGQVSDSNLDEGILSFSILNSLGNVYCERLFFRNPTSFPKISMKADQDVYGKRELVNLSFNVQSELSQTSEGFYSLSVTDSHLVKPDTINDNIISYLLLSSDLKGHIEHPTTYFINDSISSFEKLDLLMLTQGWRRYNTSDLLKDKLKKTDYSMEIEQTLTGKVLNLFGRPVKNCDVIGLVNSSIIVSNTDSLGQYVFDGIGFRDSVTFMLKADKKRIFTDVEIVPNVDVFPDPNTHFITKSMKQRVAPDEYFDQSKLKFFIDGGIRNILLDEVTVKAQKKRSGVSDNSFSSMADSHVSSNQLERMQNWSLTTILSTIPGVMVTGNKVSIRNSPGPPLIIIDGLSTDVEEMLYLVVTDIENIEVFKGAMASFFGMGSGNGVISFTTKRGTVNVARTPISIATVRPLGFQKPEQFYVPKYEVQSIRDNLNPDFRTTIYWNPSLSSDSLGMVNAQFYTADQANDYSVILEGMTKEGEICRYEGMIKRN